MSGDEVYDDDVTSGPLSMDGTYGDDMETWLTSCTCDHFHFPERGCTGCPSHSQEQWAKSLAEGEERAERERKRENGDVL